MGSWILNGTGPLLILLVTLMFFFTLRSEISNMDSEQINVMRAGFKSVCEHSHSLFVSFLPWHVERRELVENAAGAGLFTSIGGGTQQLLVH